MIIETHAHYDDSAFDGDREILIDCLRNNNIEKVINIGSSMESCRKTLEFMNQYENFFGALGVHPCEVGHLTENDIKWMEENSNHQKCVAIGEIGLDYYWNEPERELQKKYFIQQLELAKRVHLPVVIHSRDAAQDTLNIMKEYKAEKVGGVIHCFSYGVEMAKEFLELGFYIGIGGVVTFKNGKKMKEVVEYLPLESIVIETDSPYLAPEPFRGKRNDSTKLPFIIAEIGKIKGLDPLIVENIVRENALSLYPKCKI